MGLQRFCQLVGFLLVAAFITIWVNSYVRFYQEHGRLPISESDEDELSIFPDAPRNAGGGEGTVVVSPEEIPESQFYWWTLAVVIVLGVVLWECPFDSEPDVE